MNVFLFTSKIDIWKSNIFRDWNRRIKGVCSTDLQELMGTNWLNRQSEKERGGGNTDEWDRNSPIEIFIKFCCMVVISLQLQYIFKKTYLSKGAM